MATARRTTTEEPPTAEPEGDDQPVTLGGVKRVFGEMMGGLLGDGTLKVDDTAPATAPAAEKPLTAAQATEIARAEMRRVQDETKARTPPPATPAPTPTAPVEKAPARVPLLRKLLWGSDE